MKKTFSVISLGCFRNTYDSEVVTKRFVGEGYAFRQDWRKCDTILINTCGFIDKAKEESLDIIREAIDLKKQGKVKNIFVFGCLVQRHRKELEKFFPEIDRWWGIEEFKESSPVRKKLTPEHLDFIKICEGCINRCSYCAIPLIKGSLSSRPKKEIIKEAISLDKKKIKELNIIGQDITSWAKDLRCSDDLTSLLKDILKKTKNIRWIRLIYTHPRHLDNSLIDLIANEERICDYIDLPIQHISDRILRLMNRGTTKKDITDLIRKIRKKIPDCAIRTSIIVGFPTETDKEFKELIQFIRDIKFERLGAFIYSREEDTPAYKLSGQIHHARKKKRFKTVMETQREIMEEVNKRFLGKKLDVLIEEKDNNIYIGRTQYDAWEVDSSVFIEKNRLKIGQFYKVKIIDSYEYDLVGV